MNENTKRNKFCELIETFTDEDMYLVLVSCISPDTLVEQTSCERAYDLIEDIISAINEANISENKRKEWLDYANKSRNIIVQELDNIKNKNNE